MALVQATVFRGDTALTIAAAAPQGSSVPRQRRVRPNVDSPRSCVPRSTGSSSRSWRAAPTGRRFSAGANFTHVIGERLEWHGEWLVHDQTSPWIARLDPSEAGARTMSALLGLQYTSSSGVNVVLEGYRDGNGLNGAAWGRLVDGSRAATLRPAPHAVAAVRPSRRDFLFVRAARASSDARWTPELATILGVDDGSVTIVPAASWRLRAHVDVYVRGVALAGPRRSEARDAPVHATMMLGLAVRF